jgi:predicted GNAT family N-acyltransferase
MKIRKDLESAKEPRTEIIEVHSAEPIMAQAFALRNEVFVVEQGIPRELEVDEDDKTANPSCRNL